MSKHHQLLIIGGGTAGIMVASQIKKANSNISVALLDPAETHYYQPGFLFIPFNISKLLLYQNVQYGNIINTYNYKFI